MSNQELLDIYYTIDEFAKNDRLTSNESMDFLRGLSESQIDSVETYLFSRSPAVSTYVDAPKIEFKEAPDFADRPQVSFEKQMNYLKKQYLRVVKEISLTGKDPDFHKEGSRDILLSIGSALTSESMGDPGSASLLATSGISQVESRNRKLLDKKTRLENEIKKRGYQLVEYTPDEYHKAYPMRKKPIKTDYHFISVEDPSKAYEEDTRLKLEGVPAITYNKKIDDKAFEKYSKPTQGMQFGDPFSDEDIITDPISGLLRVIHKYYND